YFSVFVVPGDVVVRDGADVQALPGRVGGSGGSVDGLRDEATAADGDRTTAVSDILAVQAGVTIPNAVEALGHGLVAILVAAFEIFACTENHQVAIAGGVA